MTNEEAQRLFESPDWAQTSEPIAFLGYTDSKKEFHRCGMVKAGPRFFERLKECLELHFEKPVSINTTVIDCAECWCLWISVEGQAKPVEILFSFHPVF